MFLRFPEHISPWVSGSVRQLGDRRWNLTGLSIRRMPARRGLCPSNTACPLPVCAFLLSTCKAHLRTGSPLSLAGQESRQSSDVVCLCFKAQGGSPPFACNRRTDTLVVCCFPLPQKLTSGRHPSPFHAFALGWTTHVVGIQIQSLQPPPPRTCANTTFACAACWGEAYTHCSCSPGLRRSGGIRSRSCSSKRW